MNIAWVSGFIVGLLAVFVVSLIIRKIILKKNGTPGEYDERQVAARGKAYAIAYFTQLIYLAVWLVLNSMELPFFPTETAVLLGILISVTVFTCYSIFHDAYFRCSEKPKIWLWIIGVASLLNLVIGVGRLISHTTLQERLFDNFNLMVGIMTTLVLVFSLIKLAIDRRSEGD